MKTVKKPSAKQRTPKGVRVERLVRQALSLAQKIHQYNCDHGHWAKSVEEGFLIETLEEIQKRLPNASNSATGDRGASPAKADGKA